MDLKQRVLVVDDELRNQRIIVEILEDLVDLKICSSGEEALAVIEDFNPDLVLLDIMMAGMTGYDVCTAIRANPKLALTKVILVSGKAMVEERLKGYEVGADDYMTKPFVPEELLAKARVFLRLRRIEREFDELNKGLELEVKRRTEQLIDAESKLVTSAKMSALGEMAGGIAHEINTPLGTIGLLADQLQMQAQAGHLDAGNIETIAETISTTVDRISRIILGLRTFSRDANNDPFLKIPFTEILESTLDLCRERLSQNGVQLRIDPVPEELTIRCRQVQLSQVLLNLITNSCDAVANLPQKWIQISAEKTSNGFRLSVTDSGKGISADVAEKIFQPFFTTKEIGKGTGLGLSISKGLVAAHGGTLTIDSASENTKFILELPDGISDLSKGKES